MRSGCSGASKPSDGLGRKFPVYSYYDVVHLNYRLLRDHLKVGKVVLATGVSMGATQAYYWGLMYPDFVQAVMPVGGATATDGEGQVAAWTFQLAKAALEADPVWVETQGNYYHLPKDKHPNKGVEYHWSMLSLTGYELGAPAEPGLGRGVEGGVHAGSPTRAWARTPAPTSPTWPGSSTPSTSGTATPSARSTTSTRCCPA